MATPEDVETWNREYSPSSRVDDITVFLDAYRDRSAEARARLRCVRDIAYGPWPEARLDFFPATDSGAPLLVFVHGGYWQELSRDDSAFPALDLIPAGAAFAALGYGLAPRYPLDEIVTMVRQGLRWIADHLDELPGRPSATHLSGMSAGAHLVAMALLDGWSTDRPPVEMFAGATLLSGVYDLGELRHTYINDPLGLTGEQARRNSPLFHLPRRLPPLTIVRGDNEPAAFARQHDALVAAASHRGVDLTEFVVPCRHHFDLPFDLGAVDTRLGAQVMRGLSLSPR